MWSQVFFLPDKSNACRPSKQLFVGTAVQIIQILIQNEEKSCEGVWLNCTLTMVLKAFGMKEFLEDGFMCAESVQKKMLVSSQT